MRPKKVKRYKKIYRSSGPNYRTPLRVAGTALAVVVLAVLGWSLYGPVTSFLNGTLSAHPPESSSQVSQPPEGEVSAPDPEPESEQAVRGIYMPTAVLLDENRRAAFYATLDREQVDAVFFDLKDSAGRVTYRSAAAQSAGVDAAMPGAVDLSALVVELKGQGLRPVGRLYAFQDPLAAGQLKEAAVRYAGTEWTWLDNAQELGGKPWLNPFSETARSYVTALVEEAAAAGVERIILDGVQFPVGFSLEKADYGQPAANENRQQTLRQFVQEATSAGAAKGAQVDLYLPVTALLGTEVEKYGGDPVNILGDGVLLGVMPSLFGNAYSSADLMLADPVKDPYGTVAQALQKALPRLSVQRRTLLIQAYTATNVDSLHNIAYTAAQVEQQLRAGRENGCDDYILYDPQGAYALG